MNKFADFSKVRMDENNPRWEQAISRETELYQKEGDLRTPFERDGMRIMHSKGYRRLKNKTQVFFAPHNDHVCTRMEHVQLVASVAETIAKYLNLNKDLVRAIALGHDIGHAPFGHHGEMVLQNIASAENLHSFWHEHNSLMFIDNIETLTDNNGFQQNLDLTYAVRDGIVCHCGEVDEKFVKPRNEACDLYSIEKGGCLGPFSYEGCVVKLSDKIGYIGRDIEDGVSYGILGKEQKQDLLDVVHTIYPDIKINELNTSSFTHSLVLNLCLNSSIEGGLRFSDDCFDVLKLVKQFNYKHICNHPRISKYKKYATLILETLFEQLSGYYPNIHESINKDRTLCPQLMNAFEGWMIKYSDYNLKEKENRYCKNKQIYTISDETDYKNCVLDYISGMSDTFAIDSFHEVISF
ncbi:HD domain-containing protein [bacterium]|nr:HD domain-containing protein [bacterium]